LDDQRTALEIMALIASLGDAHSIMFPFGMKKGVLSLLPIQLYAFSDGIIVIDAPSTQSDLIGCEVLEVGGREVEQLGRAMRPFFSRDNDKFLAVEVPLGLAMPDLLAAVGADVQGGKVHLKLRKNGQTKAATVRTIEGPLDPENFHLKLIAPKHSSVP